MPLDASKLSQAIRDTFAEKPHPDIPEIKVKDYPAFAGAAAKMFYTRNPEPQQVANAYHALTNAEISPGEFDRLWDVAKPLANRLLSRDPTIHDLMMLTGQHPAQVQSYYMDHPHPQYPESSAGDIHRYATVALHPARRLQGREPNLLELHKFVQGGYSMDDVVSHYSDSGPSHPTSTSGDNQQ